VMCKGSLLVTRIRMRGATASRSTTTVAA
jgi:hypothetical protein